MNAAPTEARGVQVSRATGAVSSLMRLQGIEPRAYGRTMCALLNHCVFSPTQEGFILANHSTFGVAGKLRHQEVEVAGTLQSQSEDSNEGWRDGSEVLSLIPSHHMMAHNHPQ